MQHIAREKKKLRAKRADEHTPEGRHPSTSNVIRLQRLIGNRQTTALIQRYQVEGPWNKNDPVHEVLTLQALKQAIAQIKAEGKKTGSLLQNVNTKDAGALTSKKAHNIWPDHTHKSVQQFLRGVVWPDDPEGALFSEEDEMDYSTGAAWYADFTNEKAKGDPSMLIPRSHHGDLQFFHGMASNDNEAPEMTKERIMKWSRFLSELATGKIDPDSKIGDNPFSKELFPSHQQKTFKELFGFGKADDSEIQQRAAGALMHLIQDSNAGGHTERNEKGEIEEFHGYASQDHDKHGEKDKWAEGKTLGERIRNTPGAERAVQQCTQIMVMLDQGAPIEDIMKYLDEEIIKLAETANAAGPGEEFKKAPKK